LELKNKYLLEILNHFFRFDFYLSWIPFALFTARRIFHKNTKITFIYAAGPPFDNHIIGYLLHRKYKIPLIVEYRDIWSFNPYLNKHERWLNQKIDNFFEKKILNASRGVVNPRKFL